MAVKKLISSDFTGRGVTGLADIPNLSATEMQYKFDELSREVLTPKLNETIDSVNTHEMAENPHGVTKKQVGLDRVDNTSDMEKPVSEAQAMYMLDLASQATAIVAEHRNNIDNPHSVTSEQIGAATPEFVRNAIATITGQGTGVAAHDVLQHRDMANQHPIGAITGLNDALQTLQDHTALQENPHKTTAEQVGAAPSGYGLGTIAAQTNDWNTATKTGFYKGATNSPNGQWWEGMVIAYNEAYCVQTAWRATENLHCERVIANGTVGAWEWVNPPMELDIEYRTTERWQGKVVYTKLFSFGALPNKGMKQVLHHAGATAIVRYSSTMDNGEGLPFWYSDMSVVFDVSNSAVTVTTSYDASGRSAWVQIWYVKD